MPDDQTPDVEDEGKSLPTRERITHVALEVFAEKGLPGATMVEIAERAGLTGGALYRYFESKEEVFQAVVDEHSMTIAALDMIRGLIPELEPKTALKFIAQGTFFYFFSDVEFLRLAIGEFMRSPEISRPFFDKMLVPSLEFVMECMELWKERGLMRDEIDPAEAATAFMGMVGYYVIGQSFFPVEIVPDLDPNLVADHIATIFVEGALKGE